VLTAHGAHTIQFYEWLGAYPNAKLQEMSDVLERSGYWYEAVFGDEGDSGVVDAEWGLSAFTPDWLSCTAAPHWRVAEFASGRNEGNQDVYVLERTESADESEEVEDHQKPPLKSTITSPRNDRSAARGRLSSPRGGAQ